MNGSTSVNIAINAIQIAALLFFSALAIAYRLGHPDGSVGLALDGTGNMVAHLALRPYRRHSGASERVVGRGAAQMSWTMLQATIAILLLVGFESVTSMGEEAINPKRDIPRASSSRSRFRACSVT